MAAAVFCLAGKASPEVRRVLLSHHSERDLGEGLLQAPGHKRLCPCSAQAVIPMAMACGSLERLELGKLTVVSDGDRGVIALICLL